MSATTCTLTENWGASARYTAAALTDVYLSFPSPDAPGVIAWTTTPDDTTPAISVANASKIKPGTGVPMQLNSGERLWMASFGQPAATATLEL